jgi:hypothetical protein
MVWFSPGTLASSSTNIGRHDIAEILMKVALNTINQIKSAELIIRYQCFLFFILFNFFWERGSHFE